MLLQGPDGPRSEAPRPGHRPGLRRRVLDGLVHRLERNRPPAAARGPAEDRFAWWPSTGARDGGITATAADAHLALLEPLIRATASTDPADRDAWRRLAVSARRVVGSLLDVGALPEHLRIRGDESPARLTWVLRAARQHLAGNRSGRTRRVGGDSQEERA